MITAFRAFGHERPAAFQLITAPGPGIPIPRTEYSEAASSSVLRLAEDAVGARDALAMARTVTAWAVGFVTMELNGGFNLGGELQDAWEFGIEHVVGELRPAPEG